MKILLANTLYHPHEVGGAERSIRSIAEELVRCGHEVSVLCAVPRRSAGEGVLNGVRIHPIGLRNLYWPFGNSWRNAFLKLLWHVLDAYNPWMGREAGRILDSDPPDIVHTHNLAGLSVALWSQTRARRLPLVHTLRDFYMICPRSTLYRVNGKNGITCKGQCLRCRILTFPRRLLSRRADHVIGISRFILESHLRCGYFQGVEGRSVIHNGQERIPAARRPGAIGGPLRLGFIGRLHPEKGVGKLILAFKDGGLGKFARLVIAGDGPKSYADALREDARGLPVEFIGTTSPDDFFPRIDVLVVPSLCQEALSRAVLEAYARGVPVIASSRGGIPEIVDEGRTGLLFDPEHPQELEIAVRRVAGDPSLASRMGEAALAKSAEFSPDRVAAAHLSIYERLAGAARR